MEICGQYFSRETLRRIEGELEREPGLSRRALARRVWRLIWWRRTRRVRVELAEFASNSQSSRPGGFTPWSSRGGKRRTCRVTCIWRKRSGRCAVRLEEEGAATAGSRPVDYFSGRVSWAQGGRGPRALLRRGAVWNVCPPWSKGGNSTRPCTPPAPAFDARC